MGINNNKSIDNYADYAVADFAWHNKCINNFPTSLFTSIC